MKPRLKLYFLFGSSINVVALVAIIFIHGSMVSEATKKYIGLFMKDYRREIVGGNRSNVLMKLQGKLDSELNLTEIGYDIPGNRRKYFREDFREIENRSVLDQFLIGSAQYDFYFDENQQEKALSLVFYFKRFENISISLYIWIGLCLLSSMAWFLIYRSNLRHELVIKSAEKSEVQARIAQSLSHDMRAPLGTFERLLSKNFGDKFELQKSDVRESLHRLYAMVESLRHSETELLVIRAKHFHNFQFGMSAIKEKAAQIGVEFEFNAPERLSLFADQIKLERAWTNLLINALDVAKSKIIFEVITEGSNVKLRVIDDGLGVPKKFEKKLFQRGATFGKSGGTGLGLAYVRQIMRGHGGEVFYYRIGDQTIFECIFPNLEEKHKTLQDQKMDSTKKSDVIALKKKVAIHLENSGKSERIFRELNTLHSEIFEFNLDRNDADVVVTDIDDIIFETMESDKQELVSVARFSDDLDYLIEMLKLKFKLSSESIHV